MQWPGPAVAPGKVRHETTAADDPISVRAGPLNRMLVHLIRHGETDWNAARRVQGQMESRLSARGRQQASELAVQLQNRAIDRVFCSSSQRTRETAALLFGKRALQTSYHDALREIYLAAWEGRLYDELAAEDPQQYHYFWHQPDRFSLPGAETYARLQQRGVAALNAILAQADQQEIAVVSHGALLKSILCHYEKRHLARLWEPPAMHNCAHSILQVNPVGEVKILQYAGVDYR